jgi:hypothetical protein
MKKAMRAAPRFFGGCALLGMALANDIPVRKISRREVDGPAQHLRAGVGERERQSESESPAQDLARL